MTLPRTLVAALTMAFLLTACRCALAVPGDGSAAHEILAAPSTASTDLRAEAASFGLPEGFVVELFAAEPDVKNPVAFSVDEKGDVYVCESFRQEKGITDNRGHDRQFITIRPVMSSGIQSCFDTVSNRIYEGDGERGCGRLV